MGKGKKKDREHNQQKYIFIWRKQWEQVQNQAYERNGLDIRVSHKSLKDQGITDREPTVYLHFLDHQKELRGKRTAAGDRKRAVQRRNEERSQKQKELNREPAIDRELSR